MHLTKEQLRQIIKEEFNNLINEEEIDEKLFNALKNFGKGLLKKAQRSFSDMPDPEKSAGVGSWYAKYKEKEPTKQKKNLDLVRSQPQSLDIYSGDDTGGEEEGDIPVDTTSTKAKVRPVGLLPSPHKQADPVSISGELPPAENIPLQLPAPQRIGIVKDFGSLMHSDSGQDYVNLFYRCTNKFKQSQYYNSLDNKQKRSSIKNIDTVLKHFVSTKRVIQNPTIGPVDDVNENDSRNTPSFQQIGQTDFNSWYVRSLVATTKKYFNTSIPEEIIVFVVQFLFDDGRLAISQRLYNKLIHTQDPRIADNLEQDLEIQAESKTYNNFYYTWKNHIKAGVKI